jgi:hypothetical protein
MIKRFSKNNTCWYAQLCDVNGAVLTGTNLQTWVSLGITKDTKFTLETNDFEDTGDAGTIVTFENTPKQFKATTVFMQREAAVRNFLSGTDGLYYRVAIQGAAISTTLQQVDCIFGRFSMNFTRDTEKGYTEGVTFGSLANTAAITDFTLPTAIATATVTCTIAAGKMYLSTDVGL